MSKTLKFGGIAVGVVVLIAVAAFFFLWSSLNDIVKAAVEQVGTDVTGTEVRLKEVDISLESGKGSLRGFQVVNPSGFSRDDAFAFDEVSVTVDISTIFSDPVVVKEVVIDGPRITYELADKGANLDTIQGNVEKNTGGSGGSRGGSAGDSYTPNIIIENLYFRNGEVSVAASKFIDRKLTTPLPDLHLKDLGKQQGGADPATIAAETMDELYKSTLSAIRSANIDLDGLRRGLEEGLQDAGRMAEEGAKDAMEGAGQAADEAGKAADEAGKGIEKGLDDAGKAVKGLFD